MTEEEIAQMKADLKKESDGFNRWNWFALLEKLSHGDVTKFDEVSNQNFILCLNLLSYWMEKEKRIARMQEEYNRSVNHN
tara:strand:+ start:208 stop:447 length:240 start_codon:yes stop_codon:yes gene_type:complete